MKSLRAVLMTAVAAFGVVSAATATAGEAELFHSRVVKYDDLDINSEQGAKALYTRLRSAARIVCANLEGREIRQKLEWKSCFDQALTRSVAEVNQERVTALHRSRADRQS